MSKAAVDIDINDWPDDLNAYPPSAVEPPNVTASASRVVSNFTDASYAEDFAQAYGDRLRFNHRRGAWYIYDPAPLWRADTDGEVYRLAIEFARARQLDALGLPDRDRRDRAVKWALQAESKSGLERLVSLARHIKPLADAGDGWDADPWLVGAPNGILDMRRGALLDDPRPDLRITMSVGVPFLPEAACPRFEQFLTEIFHGDAELIGFVQRFFGYALTGITTEQVLLLCHGTGANGKSTLINILSHVFGDYALNLPFSSIELKQRASIPSDLAGLDGRRLATASETNDGTRLNEARVKALTGCDPITARFMHADWFTFKPVATFVLAVNHKPTVNDDSHGFWRRIRLVPFLQRFDGVDRDDRLEERLRAEAAGILAWCVRGCLNWQEHGLGLPASVAAATTAYQADSDPVAEFVEDCCAIEPQSTTKAAALQEAYAKWAERQRIAKHERLSAKEFGRRMADRFNRRHTREGWIYEGVKLQTSLLGL